MKFFAILMNLLFFTLSHGAAKIIKETETVNPAVDNIDGKKEKKEDKILKEIDVNYSETDPVRYEKLKQIFEKNSAAKVLPEVLNELIFNYLRSSDFVLDKNFDFGIRLRDILKTNNDDTILVLSEVGDLTKYNVNTSTTKYLFFGIPVKLSSMIQLKDSRIGFINNNFTKFGTFNLKTNDTKITGTLPGINLIKELDNGNLVSLLKNGNIQIWSKDLNRIGSGNLILRKGIRQIIPVNDSIIALVTHDTVELFDTSNESTIKKFSAKPFDLLRLKNGNFLIYRYGEIEIWDNSLKRLLKSFKQFDDKQLNSVTKKPDLLSILETTDGKIVIANDAGQLFICDIGNGKIFTIKLNKNVTKILELDNGDIAVGALDGSIMIINSVDKTLKLLFDGRRHQSSELVNLLQVADGKLVASWNDYGKIISWKRDSRLDIPESSDSSSCVIC